MLTTVTKQRRFLKDTRTGPSPVVSHDPELKYDYTCHGGIRPLAISRSAHHQGTHSLKSK